MIAYCRRIIRKALTSLSKEKAEPINVHIEKLRLQIRYKRKRENLNYKQLHADIRCLLEDLKRYYFNLDDFQKRIVKKSIFNNLDNSLFEYFNTGKYGDIGKEKVLSYFAVYNFYRGKTQGTSMTGLVLDSLCLYVGCAGMNSFRKSHKISVKELFQILEDCKDPTCKKLVDQYDLVPLNIDTKEIEKSKSNFIVNLKRNSRKIAALFLIVALITISVFIFKNRNTPIDYYQSFLRDQTTQFDSITDHHQRNIGQLFSKDSTKFRLLILPFDPVKNCTIEKSGYERQILQRFDSIIKKDRLKMEVHYYSELPYYENKIYDYSSILLKYNLDLVLWGGYEEKCGDATSIYIKHSYNTDRFYGINDVPNNKSKGKEKEIYKEGDSGIHSLEMVSDLKNGYLQGGINDIVFWSLSKYYSKKEDHQKSLNSIKHLLNPERIHPIHYTVALINTFQLKDTVNSLKYAKIIAKGRLFGNKRKDITFLELLEHPKLCMPTFFEKFAWHIIALDFGNQEDYDTCLKIYLKILDSFPEDYIIWRQLGVVYSKLGEKKKAVESYLNAIKYDSPWPEEHWFSLGVLYGDLGWFGKEEEAYKKSLRIDSLHYKSWLNLSIVFDKRKEDRKATQALDKALEVNPNYAKAWFRKAIRFSKSKNDTHAEKAINKAIALDSLNGGFWAAKGTILILRTNGKMDAVTLEKSKMAIDRALELDPKSAHSWVAKSLLLEYEGKKIESKRAYFKATNLDPKLKKTKRHFPFTY